MTITVPALDPRGLTLRSIRARAPWLATLLLATAPAWFALVDALRSGWTPEGDDALVALKVMDIVDGRWPLMGMRSTSGLGDPSLASHHLGPLEFYLLAPVSWLGRFSPLAIASATVLLNVAFVAAALWLARRLGGRLLVLLVAAAALAVQWGLGTETLYRPLNTNPAPLAVLAMLLAATAALRGYRTGRWLLVLLMSFVAQANLAYLPLVGGLAVVLIVASLARRRGRGYVRPPGERTKSIRSAVVVGVLVWLPTALETTTFRPPNVAQVLRYATQDNRQLIDPGATFRLVGVLGPVPGGFGRVDSSFLVSRGVAASVVGVLLIGALAVMAVRPPRDGVVGPGAVVALTGAVAILIGYSRLPAGVVPATYWVTPIMAVAAWAWCVLVVAALERAGGRHCRSVRVASSWTSVLLPLAVMALMTTPTTRHDATAVPHGIREAVTELVGEGPLASADSVRIETVGSASWFSYGACATYAFREQGLATYAGAGWPFPEDVDWRAAAAAPPTAPTAVVADLAGPSAVPAGADPLATVPGARAGHPGAVLYIAADRS